MLSIIICSKSHQISPALKENINQTVGVEHEVIVIDNSQNEFSIFSAYNLGLKQSKYALLCFVHDDVVFRTPDWGKKIQSHLFRKEVGIIGVAGGDTLTRVPSSWSSSGVAENFIQSDKSRKRKRKHEFKRNTNSYMQEVLVLDGFWLCMRKEIFSRIKFDQNIFDGFHVYDIDICLQSKSFGYKNFVVFDILLEHTSVGYKDIKWVESLLKLERKWRNHLPLSIGNYSLGQLLVLEKKVLFRLTKRMVKLNYPVDKILKLTHRFRYRLEAKSSHTLLYLRIMALKTLVRMGVI
jgi:hypothetical protein